MQITYPGHWIVNPNYIIINLIENNVQSDLSLALQYHGFYQDERLHSGQKYFENIENSAHFKYLKNYLWDDSEGLKIQTIVIERTYTSLSYQADFLNYYGRTYYPYIKDCSRIHFFAEVTDGLFTSKELEEYLFSSKDSPLCEKFKIAYRGHIVIKKLPKGSIGASLLPTYSNIKKDGYTRFYTAVRNYEVNFFGKKINVRTMPYQEQDSIIGYCATSALWFAFQITSFLFNSHVPNPSEITLSAGHDSNHTGKNFPRNGLELRQVCQAIYSTGLIAEMRNSDVLLDDRYLKAYVYAYLKMGLPVLLGIEIENDEDLDHLVTLNGYRIDPNLTIKEDESGYKVRLVSDQITRFYAHDDQVGPFARLEFADKQTKQGGKQQIKYQFITAWAKSKLENSGYFGADSKSVIIPITDKVKVIFEDMFVESMLNEFIISTYVNVEIVWDIFLCKSNDYKDELLVELRSLGINEIDNPDAYKIFLRSLPQYIWVVKGYWEEEGKKGLMFDFIYDAADQYYHRSPFTVNIFDKEFFNTVENSNIEELLNLFNMNGSTKASDIEDLVNKGREIGGGIEGSYNQSFNQKEEKDTKSKSDLNERITSREKEKKNPVKNQRSTPKIVRAAKEVERKKSLSLLGLEELLEPKLKKQKKATHKKSEIDDIFNVNKKGKTKKKAM